MSLMLRDEREISTAGLDSVESPMPGVDTAELIAAEFRKSDALLTVGTKKTLIVAQPKRALIGFRNLIDKLHGIDLADDRRRILVWILDLGRQSFDDEDARLRFLNVEELISRFEALKVFKDRYMEARWRWLQSNAVILLRNFHDYGSEATGPSDFVADHILFEAVPSSWEKSPNFRALYGRDFQQLNEMNCSIFVNRTAGGLVDDPSKNGSGARTLRYYGHAKFTSIADGDREIRGLELPAPERQYDAAFGSVYATATYVLRSREPHESPSVDGERAINELKNLGFLVLRVDEFIRRERF
jgi:hypothetical protein